MSDDREEGEQLPFDLENQIDGLSDEYEAKWKAGESPQIENYLDRIPSAGRPHLLEELLAVQFDLCQQSGQPLEIESYRKRFPADGATIDAALGKHLRHIESHDGTQLKPLAPLNIRIRCPHCHNAIEIIEDSSFRDVECSSCGSHFNLVGNDAPTVSGRSRHRTLAHFELIEQLGVGSYGAVWKARDTTLDRIVALKIPRKENLDECDVESFFREARAAAQLRHTNIVGVHEVGRDGDTIFIASDYVDGATLKEWLGGQPLPPREAARLCMKIAMALQAAHDAGVIHRDLKPGNIMIDMDGEPHIMDFGLARRESGEMTITVDGALLGTPAYMPPEQAAGRGHQADSRSDIYSLGVILFETLTGELPFRGEKRMLLVQIQRDDAPSLRKLDFRIPRDLETICLK